MASKKVQNAVRTSLGACPVLVEMIKQKRLRQKALMGVQLVDNCNKGR